MPEIIEQEEKIWNPRYLKPEERELTRELYHAVFAEDTERFVDYYYQYKIRDNAILVLEEKEKLISMLHLNPYTMIVNGYEFPCNYIVAVATDPDYRHQGCMTWLIERCRLRFSCRPVRVSMRPLILYGSARLRNCPCGCLE